MAKVNITELDFSQVKNNLKDFMRSQKEFQDINFEGSGINILLDVLSFNTHYQAYYLAAVANEMYLDSAILRNSVVSRAKSIGYFPRSSRSARAIINIEIMPSGNPSNILVPKGVRFSSVIDNRIYTFSTTIGHTVYPDTDGKFRLANVELIEGKPLTHQFTYEASSPKRFILPNLTIDTTSIIVKVVASSTDGTTEYFNHVSDFNELIPSSAVYFLQEIFDGEIEVYFGDGVVGKALNDGNIVVVHYNLSSGEAANSAAKFAPAQQLPGGHSMRVTSTVTPANGGAPAESIESIRYLAPLNYQSQDRAVTKGDYEVLIKKDYPAIDAVRVWGGEENDPPHYGKVFISLKPEEGFTISQPTKQYIIDNIIGRRNMIGTEVVIIDPVYIYVIVNSFVKYKSALTQNTASEIAMTVTDAIADFGENELNRFDTYLRYSKFVQMIDGAHPAILNNLTNIKLKFKLFPVFNLPTQYVIDFDNPIDSALTSLGKSTLQSSGFVYQGYTAFFQDDGKGTVQIYRASDTGNVIVSREAGTIDYLTGRVTLTSFAPSGITSGDAFIEIIVRPQANDVSTVRNHILVIDDRDIRIEVIDESTVAV